MDTQNENLDTKARLSLAQWTLDKNLGWIAASEVKSAFTFAAAASMLGVLYSSISSIVWLSPCLVYLAITSFLLLGVACLHTILVVIPRLGGPSDSLLFFGVASQKTIEEYKKQFLESSSREMLEDMASQIHRNSEIANKKQRLVKRGIIFLILGAIPWILSMSLVLIIKWH
jgi:Family of unknown function (DUF5706)